MIEGPILKKKASFIISSRTTYSDWILRQLKYQDNSTQDSTSYYSLFYKLNQQIFRADFTYRASEKHKIDFGLDATNYFLSPGIQKPVGIYSDILPKELESEKALEPSLYISDEFDATPRILISGGLRFTMFTAFGPQTQYIYNPDGPRSLENIVDTIHYGTGKIIQSYPGLEFRFSTVCYCSRFIGKSRYPEELPVSEYGLKYNFNDPDRYLEAE
jgi:hypothetical protein